MLEASSKEGGWPCLVAAGGKSKLPDLLGRQCVEWKRKKKIYKKGMRSGKRAKVRFTMVDRANGRVIGREYEHVW